MGSILSANGGFGYLAIHAVQFGAQPLLSKAFITPGTPTSSLVLGAEFVKTLGCIAMLYTDGDLGKVLRSWTFQRFILVAGVPSLTYLVQNWCIQVAYQHVDGVIFNILNQSKMPFTALFAFFILGKRQSQIQCIALFAVTIAGILIATNAPVNEVNGHEDKNGYSYWSMSSVGILCVILASALSGVGSGVVEWTLQGKEKRNSYLFTAEMALLGSLVIFLSLYFDISAEGEIWRKEGLFAKWTKYTWIPVLTQGLGGIVVGLITKVAGGVKKGFAVICGLVFTCMWKCFVYAEPLSPQTFLAVPLVAASIYLHAKYPPEKKHDA